MTFLTFCSTFHFYRYAVYLVVRQFLMEFGEDRIIVVVSKLNLGGTVAIDAPAHAQGCKLVNFIFVLDGTMAGLALYLSDCHML
jgi:hypothetical protein